MFQARADASLMASGPLSVPFPKLVVISTGTPYNTTSESINETVCGICILPGFFQGLQITAPINQIHISITKK
jgi:hypothetical protein